MTLKHLRAIKILVPVPQLDGHVIGGGQNIWQSRVNLQGSNVVAMRFKLLNFLHGVVVEHSQAHIIRRRDEPLLARDKLGTSDGQFTEFKGLDATSGLVVPNHDNAAVQGSKYPWFAVVNINGLDAF